MGKLYLANERKIFGVCSGIAKNFNTDVAIVRLIWILSILFFGIGILAYLTLWAILPKESSKKDYAQRMNERLNSKIGKNK